MSEPDLRATQARVQRAVADAQVVTGLQFTVVFCLGGGGLREQADREFERLGVSARPAVLLLVEPVAGSFELVLDGRAGRRLDDGHCSTAVEEMTGCYDRTGDLAECVEQGFAVLRGAAGSGAEEPGPAVPDVVLVLPDAD